MAHFASRPSSVMSYSTPTPSSYSNRPSLSTPTPKRVSQSSYYSPSNGSNARPRSRPASSLAALPSSQRGLSTGSSSTIRSRSSLSSLSGYNNSSNNNSNNYPAFAPPLSARSNSQMSSRPSSRAASRPSSSMGFYSPTASSFSNSSNSNTSYTGSIKVSVRPRPIDGAIYGVQGSFNSDPTTNPNTSAWTINTTANTISNFEMGDYSYDHVFEPYVSNNEVYNKVVEPVVSQCMDGYNGTIFAYGMTGSGKTYSMQGYGSEPGLIQLCVSQLFTRLRNYVKNEVKTAEPDSVKVTVSYLEIYNEKLFDLLNPASADSLRSSCGGPSYGYGGATPSTTGTTEELRIREDPVYGVKVTGLTELEVLTADDLLENISKGDTIRRTGGTDFNARSSRSHAVVLIRVHLKDPTNGTSKVSTLSLCDLAGSEKAATQAERRKEGSYINKSLLALSTVISKLSQGSSNHIPYRDSKLTRLLQPALSGNAIVSILCTIHLSAVTLAETTNTLRFASRAKNITVTVRKNEVSGLMDKDKYIETLLRDNEHQRQEIKTLRAKQQQALASAGSVSGSVPGTPLLSTHPLSRNNSTASNTTSLASTLNPNFMASIAGHENEVYAELIAENKILNEQLEHLKRLNDTDTMNSIISHNEYLQILRQLQQQVSDVVVKDALPESVSTKFEDCVLGLENANKSMLAKMEEMKSYIKHLESLVGVKAYDLAVVEEKHVAHLPSVHGAKGSRGRASVLGGLGSTSGSIHSFNGSSISSPLSKSVSVSDRVNGSGSSVSSTSSSRSAQSLNSDMEDDKMSTNTRLTTPSPTLSFASLKSTSVGVGAIEDSPKQQLLLNQHAATSSSTSTTTSGVSMSTINSTNNADTSIMKEKQEEIETLRKMLQSKDLIIKALRSTSKVRDVIVQSGDFSNFNINDFCNGNKSGFNSNRSSIIGSVGPLSRKNTIGSENGSEREIRANITVLANLDEDAENDIENELPTAPLKLVGLSNNSSSSVVSGGSGEISGRSSVGNRSSGSRDSLGKPLKSIGNVV
ncbi:unnamed protein product [Ambrosiozyma monospora]|uniref:Unnamed protein product n=1 Tax=Ambrosiozyma monospora TaxID=43982 RepID=A0ACB5SWH0_AMBMO|nr:unnamed protein product [Ambrosiozyma monospora]